MAAVQLSYRATEYDLLNKSSREVMLVGEAFLTDVAPGHPLPPGEKPPGLPPFYPAHPGPILPGDPGWGPPYPIQPPPGHNPPDISPGDPTTPVPPPAGQPGWPVNPMTPPPYIIVNYPGVGPVYVAPPAPSS